MAYDEKYCPACARSAPLNAPRCTCGHTYSVDELPILLKPDPPLVRELANWAWAMAAGIGVGLCAMFWYSFRPVTRLLDRTGHLYDIVKSDSLGWMGLRFVVGFVIGMLVGRLLIRWYVDRQLRRDNRSDLSRRQ